MSLKMLGTLYIALSRITRKVIKDVELKEKVLYLRKTVYVGGKDTANNSNLEYILIILKLLLINLFWRTKMYSVCKLLLYIFSLLTYFWVSCYLMKGNLEIWEGNLILLLCKRALKPSSGAQCSLMINYLPSTYRIRNHWQWQHSIE